MDKLTINMQDRNHTWHPIEWLLMSLLVLNIIDFVTTYIAVEIIGHIEANPVLNYLIQITGTVWSILIVKIVFFSYLIISYELYEKFRNAMQKTLFLGAFAVLNVIYLGVVLHNLHLIIYGTYMFS